MGQHRDALMRHNTSNALIVHADTDGHLHNWTQAVVVNDGLASRQRKIFEAAIIQTRLNLNTSPGSHDLAKVVACHVAEVM